MSYDIYLRSTHGSCPTCGHPSSEPDLPTPTYNLTPIFDLAFTGEPMPNQDVTEAAVVLLGKSTDRPRGLRLLSGRKASDTVALLQKALTHLQDRAKEPSFRALEPSNRWGTLNDARAVVTDLLSAAGRYPEHIWTVH